MLHVYEQILKEDFIMKIAVVAANGRVAGKVITEAVNRGFDVTAFGRQDNNTVTAKIELILRAQKEGIPIISAMGAGNKLDAGRLKIADIYDTKICPLARVMRRELKKRNVKSLKVVYSDEQPIRPIEDMSISCRTHCICPPGAQHKCTERRDIPGSTAFVPAVAGLLIAGEVIRDLAANTIFF